MFRFSSIIELGTAIWMGLNIFSWGDRGRCDIISYNGMNNKLFVKTLMFVFQVAFSAERGYGFLCRVKQRAMANENEDKLLKSSEAKENLKSVLVFAVRPGSWGKVWNVDLGG